MAKKKDDESKEVAEVAAPRGLDERQAERFESERSGVNIPPAEREVLDRPMSERLASLLEDHKRMGVR